MARPGYPHPMNLKGSPTPAWRAEPRYVQPSRCGSCVTAPEQREMSWNRRLIPYNNAPCADGSGAESTSCTNPLPAPAPAPVCGISHPPSTATGCSR